MPTRFVTEGYIPYPAVSGKHFTWSKSTITSRTGVGCWDGGGLVLFEFITWVVIPRVWIIFLHFSRSDNLHVVCWNCKWINACIIKIRRILIHIYHINAIQKCLFSCYVMYICSGSETCDKSHLTQHICNISTKVLVSCHWAKHSSRYGVHWVVPYNLCEATRRPAAPSRDTLQGGVTTENASKCAKIYSVVIGFHSWWYSFYKICLRVIVKQ